MDGANGIATKIDGVQVLQPFDGEDGPFDGEDGGVVSRAFSNELTGSVTSAETTPTVGLAVSGKLPVTSAVATSGPDLLESFTLDYTDQDPKGSSGDLLQSATQDYTDQDPKGRTDHNSNDNTNAALQIRPDGERMCSSSSVSVYEPPTRSGKQLESVLSHRVTHRTERT